MWTDCAPHLSDAASSTLANSVAPTSDDDNVECADAVGDDGDDDR